MSQRALDDQRREVKDRTRRRREADMAESQRQAVEPNRRHGR